MVPRVCLAQAAELLSNPRHFIPTTQLAPPTDPALCPERLDARPLSPILNSRRWHGLSWRDKHLLGLVVDRLPGPEIELWTDVPVCLPADLPPDPRPYDITATYKYAWSRKADAIIHYADYWWLAECKPCADYVALGQLLFYVYHARRLYAELCGVLPLLITDQCSSDTVPLFQTLGIPIIECGRVLSDSRLPQ
jgi:hypothetical protein